MLPEARLIKSELTLRDLALPDDVVLARKSLVRWIALSLGLVSPNETRLLILDVLDALLSFHVQKEAPTTEQVMGRLKEVTGKEQGLKAVYYHLLRLKEKGIIIRKKGRYYLYGEDWKSLPELFRQLYFQKADEVFRRIDVALKKLEGSYTI